MAFGSFDSAFLYINLYQTGALSTLAKKQPNRIVSTDVTE